MGEWGGWGCCFQHRRETRVHTLSSDQKGCAPPSARAHVSARATYMTTHVPACTMHTKFNNLLQLQINSNLVLTLKMNSILC